MAKNPYGVGPGQKQVVVMRPKPKMKKQFRWWLLWLPAGLILVAWLTKAINLSGVWGSAMTALNVHNRERYTTLFCLGLACVAIVAIARILRDKSNDRS
jgi:hypothetical protein